MGEKKKKEEKSKRLKQVLVVGACVLFVVLMVVSAMGSGWITGLAAIKPGDSVVLDYTLYNPDGKVIVTSDQQLWKSSGNVPLLSKQLTFIANQSYSGHLYPVPVYSSGSGWQDQIAFHTAEFTAISQGVVGMKDNEKKTIALPPPVPDTIVYGADELASNDLKISDLQKGDLFPLGESENPATSAANATGPVYMRIGDITGVGPQNVTVDFSYPRIDVSIVTINGR